MASTASNEFAFATGGASTLQWKRHISWGGNRATSVHEVSSPWCFANFRVRLVAMKMAVFSSIMTVIVLTAIINNGRVFGSP